MDTSLLVRQLLSLNLHVAQTCYLLHCWLSKIQPKSPKIPEIPVYACLFFVSAMKYIADGDVLCPNRAYSVQTIANRNRSTDIAI